MQKNSLNHGWQFFHGNITRRNEPDDNDWQPVDLPHDWSVYYPRSADQPSGASNGWFEMGRGYYRQSIDAPEVWRGKKVLVEFEGVYMNAEVYLNENLVDRHPYGYTSFICDLTSYLKFGEQNVLKVHVDNAAQMNSRWYSGSGMYRPAWLLIAEPVHVCHWGVYVTTPDVSTQKATVQAQVKVQNEGDTSQEVVVQGRIYGPDNSVCVTMEKRSAIPAGAEQVFEQIFEVQNPQLWSPETPNLYRLETLVHVDGKTVDRETTNFGIRSIAFSAEQGLLLNGQPLKLKGGCVHHDNGIIGSAAYRRSEERKVEVHKASGYNAIRTAHNPPSPAFLEACDRLGMLVMDEAFDCWRQGKNPYDYHLYFDDWWQRDIESMVLRDRNHPCVILWSIGNEVLERDGRSGGAQIARALAGHVRKLDPTRPVTAAINGVWDKTHVWEDTDVVFAALDVGGYNYKYKQYIPDHERHPHRIMAGTESTAMEAFDTWMSVLDLPYVIGDFVWTSLDYLGESGIGRVHFDQGKASFLGEYPWNQANCGDLDLCGWKRPQSYYRDILWNTGSPLYIAVHTPIPEGQQPVITYWGWPDVSASWNWPGQDGEPFKVDVYSACDQVELFLNGRSLGVKPTTRTERFIATFEEVPYEPGVLKAVGYREGKEVAEWAVQTAGAPAKIHLAPDRPTLTAGEPDLCYVTVEVQDPAGCLHPSANQEIYFTIQGEGSILAVGSSNPQTDEMYTGNRRRAYQGRCLVVVKSTGKAGEIHLRAQADGLNTAEVTIQIT